MPNVDDHGLEVLKKAARNLDPTPKKDYALQVIVVADESTGGGAPLSTTIINHSIPVKDVEHQINLPANCKAFLLRPRKNSRLKLSYDLGGTNTLFVTVPLGGYWVENKALQSASVFVQSSVDNNVIELVAYN